MIAATKNSVFNWMLESASCLVLKDGRVVRIEDGEWHAHTSDGGRSEGRRTLAELLAMLLTEQGTSDVSKECEQVIS